MSKLQRHVDRIHNEIPLIHVLADYGYLVDRSGADHEQQFPCDLHGGADNKPSARYYAGTSQFFCFACGRSRDAIALVQEKEGIPFWKAVQLLEKQHNLPPLGLLEGEEEYKSPAQQVEEAFHLPTETLETVTRRVEAFLTACTRERTLPLLRIVGFWEVFDKVLYLHRENEDEAATILSLHKILAKVKDSLGVTA